MRVTSSEIPEVEIIQEIFSTKCVFFFLLLLFTQDNTKEQTFFYIFSGLLSVRS